MLIGSILGVLVGLVAVCFSRRISEVMVRVSRDLFNDDRSARGATPGSVLCGGLMVGLVSLVFLVRQVW